MAEGEHKHDSEKHEHASHEAHHETHHEVHHEHHSAKKSGGMMPVYLVITAIVFLAAGLVAGGAMSGSAVSKDAAAAKAISYINANLVAGGRSVNMTAVNETNGMYEVRLSMSGNDVGSVFVSRDGKYIVLGSVLDMAVPIPKEDASTGSQAAASVPKSDKPVLNLFVWTFCPYGVSAETTLSPVYSLLKSKADINVRFIGPVTADKATAAGSCFAGRTETTDDAKLKACCVTYTVGGQTTYGCGLHNANEAKEAARQVCIVSDYGKDKLWEYLAQANTKCYPLYQDTAKLDACWKDVASGIGIDTAKLESCSTGKQALDLLKSDADLANSLGISSSPTFMINGQKVSGGSPDGVKSSLCSAFNTVPSECGQSLSTAGAQASGGCG